MIEEPELVVRLRGSGWLAELVVVPPENLDARTVHFNVPAPGTPDGMRLIEAEVLYTEAHNRLAAHWQHWHVKIYRCGTRTDTEMLRSYLRQQTADVHGANADLPGPDRTPIEPPWAVVPVHIVNIDGSAESLDGTVQTQLALPPAELLRQVRVTYPSWFDHGVPSPDLYLLAVSPWMKQLKWPHFRARPAVEQLVDFLGMGAGLDALHRRGMIHCDIKPDNVCRYHTANAAGFVLIDMDAATRLFPQPETLRITERWAYGRLLQGHRSSQLLLAHDRFGFALVVLCALAGREWVEQSLLADLGGRVRAADDREKVRDALRRRWQDTAELHWDPLIDAAVEPFGRDVEHPDWSAFRWINDLIDAEHQCVVRQGPTDVPPQPDRPDLYRREIEGIRERALALPAPLKERIERGYQEVQERAWALAVRNAMIAGAVWGGGLIVAVAALALIAFGVG